MAPPQGCRPMVALLVLVLVGAGDAAAREGEGEQPSSNLTNRHLLGAARGDPSRWKERLDQWVMGRWEKDEFVPEATTEADGGDWDAATYWKRAGRGDGWPVISKEEAADCLRAKGGIAVSGDSYMVGLFVGIADHLTGDRSGISRYANNKDGYTVESEWQRKVDRLKLGFPVKSNYGKWAPSMMYKLVEKLDKGDRKTTAMVEGWAQMGLVAYNALMHDAKEQTVKKKGEHRSLEDYKENVQKFAQHMKKFGVKLVWVTGPSQDLKYVFARYQRFQNNHRMLRWNTAAVEVMKSQGFPFLDTFHMGVTCKANNCYDGAKGDKSKRTIDGHHRSRFVNRMKARMLLHYLCKGGQGGGGGGGGASSSGGGGEPLADQKLAEWHKFKSDKVRT